MPPIISKHGSFWGCFGYVALEYFTFLPLGAHTEGQFSPINFHRVTDHGALNLNFIVPSTFLHVAHATHLG